MREIKFRAWDGKMGRWLRFDREYPLKIAEKPLVKDFVKIMQYTGLKDKNGKEIYEGDIVEWYGTNGMCRMEMKYDITHQKYIPYINSSSEVIGNIYENPEFLK